jgi:hypothetical protein
MPSMDLRQDYHGETFHFWKKINLDQDNTPTIPRTDYVANPNAKTYAVAVDPFRKLDGQKTSFLMMMIDSVIIL